jgi:hypothetical protein
MKEIKLSKNGKSRGLYVALVDDADYEWLGQFTWFVLKGTTDHHYAGTTVDGKITLMHRLIMQVTNTKSFIDHIDRDGLNNQRHNLRISTNAQNQYNAKKHRLKKETRPSSKYKGVSWLKKRKKWASKAKINKKLIWLGYYDLEKDAARAYNDFASKNFGEFARLNVIE